MEKEDKLYEGCTKEELIERLAKAEERIANLERDLRITRMWIPFNNSPIYSDKV